MATKKKAPPKKAAKKASPRNSKNAKAGKGKTAPPPKVIIKEQPPIRIIIEVVVRCEGKNTNSTTLFSNNLIEAARGITPRTASFKSEEEIEKDVKEFILTNSPKTDLTIDDLANDDKLKEHLDYQSDDYDTLQIDLDKYVSDGKDGQHVSLSEVTTNKTVGKIIKMVKDKLL